MADDPNPPGGRPKGPFAPRVWTPPKADPAERAPREGPLVTEGMKARRREMERRRREKALEQLQQEEEAMESWARARRFALAFFLVLAAVAAYWRIQEQYGNRWPLGYVWAAMSIALLGTLGWMVWYLNKTE
jgi:di/tricarboxylate transporter